MKLYSNKPYPLIRFDFKAKYTVFLSKFVSRTFSKKDHFFDQKISKILCLAFDFICIYYMSSDY